MKNIIPNYVMAIICNNPDKTLDELNELLRKEYRRKQKNREAVARFRKKEKKNVREK